MKESLSTKEYLRYSRHLALSGFGLEGQLKLKTAKVLVVGAGGLGSPVLLYLAAAGIGHIGIVDHDRVDETNLQRQVLYNTEDLGENKAHLAAQKLKALNPEIEVSIYDTLLTKENALGIIEEYDVVADGTDNFPTRYLVNDACVLLDKVNVYASLFRFEGQVAVFNHLEKSGVRGPNYRDIFPEPPPPGLVPNCAEGGILGVMAGMIGCMQANEVIKVISGVGEPLSGKILLVDALTMNTRTIKVKKRADTKIDGLIDYEVFCNTAVEENVIKEISVEELKKWKVTQIDFQLIDVREAYEYKIENMEGLLIPLSKIREQSYLISRDKKVVLHCKSGQRSARAIQLLEDEFGFGNLYNLEGGIMAWKAR